MASRSKPVLTLRHKSRFFTRKRISKLQNSGIVDLPDFISLVFLMCESDQFSNMYNPLRNLNSANFPGKLDFFDFFNQFSNWEHRFMEALERLNNKKALFLLNIRTSDLSVDDHTYCLSPSRVILYRVLEELSGADGKRLIECMKKLGAPMPTEELSFLELYFMFWHINGFVNVDYQDGFEIVALSLSNIGKTGLANTLGPCLEQLYMRSTFDDHFPIEIYPIQDVKQTGLCLIINQVRYGGKATDRESSLVDVEKLKRLMNSLNLAVIALEDVVAFEFCELIKNNVLEHFLEEYSVFMLVVMAHGELGRVICPKFKNRKAKNDTTLPESKTLTEDAFSFVMVKDIQNCIFECDILKGKPKIVILNACRGESSFTTKNYFETEMTTDDAKLQVNSQVDIITCYSTLPEFISFRDREKGSLFINVFCDVLSKRPDIEVCELFTLVNARLMQPTPALSRGFERGCRGNYEKLANPLEFTSALTKKLHLKVPDHHK